MHTHEHTVTHIHTQTSEVSMQRNDQHIGAWQVECTEMQDIHCTTQHTHSHHLCVCSGHSGSLSFQYTEPFRPQWLNDTAHSSGRTDLHKALTTVTKNALTCDSGPYSPRKRYWSVILDFQPSTIRSKITDKQTKSEFRWEKAATMLTIKIFMSKGSWKSMPLQKMASTLRLPTTKIIYNSCYFSIYSADI